MIRIQKKYLITYQKKLVVIKNGDHVVCSISGKKISLEKLTYWNVELQEPYFSYIEASKKREK